MSILIESPDDVVLQEDLDILADTLSTEEFQGRSVLVTGATGLLGSQIVKTLLCLNRKHLANIKVYAWARNEHKAKKIFGDLLGLDTMNLIIADIVDFPELPRKMDYIIHTASATSSQYFVTHPVETIMTALAGTQNVLSLARELNIKSFLYLSSLEVYGVPNDAKKLIAENDYGYIDPLSIRSSYSEGKRMAECLCASYVSEYSLPVKVARLSQTFGPGVEYQDKRVFAEFARCVIEGNDIVLHTPGQTVRSYCYTRDAILALFAILTKGENGQAYNITNQNTVCSIKEMADLVCSLYPEKKISVQMDIPEDISALGYNPELVIKLDNARVCALGWKPSVNLPDSLRRMISSMEAQ